MQDRFSSWYEDKAADELIRGHETPSCVRLWAELKQQPQRHKSPGKLNFKYYETASSLK